jgi:hypothetical protein
MCTTACSVQRVVMLLSILCYPQQCPVQSITQSKMFGVPDFYYNNESSHEADEVINVACFRDHRRAPDSN